MKYNKMNFTYRIPHEENTVPEYTSSLIENATHFQ